MSTATVEHKLLKAINKVNSRTPLTTKDLLKYGEEEQVLSVLNKLYSDRVINSCLSIKDGETNTQWWPIGVIDKLDYNTVPLVQDDN